MKRILAALLLALFLPPFAAASVRPQAGGVQGHLLDYGIVVISHQLPRYEVPGQKGRFAIKSQFEFTKKTDEIPLQKGVAFGIAWAISGLHENSIEVTYTVEHPEMILENGKKSRVMTQTIPLEVVDGVAGSADGYVLNHEYELVPGDWKISIKYKDIEISKIFKVR